MIGVLFWVFLPVSIRCLNFAIPNQQQVAADPMRVAPVVLANAQQSPGLGMSSAGFPAAVIPVDPQYYQQGAAVAPLSILNSPCADNITCSALPNAYCGSNRTCQCMQNFIEDPVFTGTCKLAPGYNEPCGTGDTECRQPFVCNASTMCDCKPGFLQEYFQCVKDCPTGQVPVNDACMPARQLEEKCEANEQCMQSYSQCLHNKCQCITGTNQLNGSCYPVNQCPLGDPAKDKRGKVQACTADNEEVCAKDFYCLHADSGSPNGFCCPKIKMNCPIGQPLDGYNCTNCPWETHHCFSYVIGTYTETMCCPNACPSGHPIQKDGKCYAKVAYGGHCMIDEQCYNVLGSTCRKGKDGKNRCLCPEGNFRNYYGRCLREAALGEDCTANEECRQGTNTLCSNGVCACFNGYIPEPTKGSRSTVTTIQRCIAEPSCPTATGLKRMESYAECKDDSQSCKENEFCRRWWNEANHTYSLCCPKPKFSDYEAMCKPFRMKLMAVPKKTEPIRCDITSMPHHQLYDATANTSAPIICPSGASCLFDPYSMDKGICCKPDDTNRPGASPTPLGQSPLPPVGKAAPIGKGGNITVAPASSVAIRPFRPAPATVANVSASTGNNSASKVEAIDEEDLLNSRPIGSKSPPAPTVQVPSSSSILVNGTATPPVRPPGANTNIPVVRIRGHQNNQQG